MVIYTIYTYMYVPLVFPVQVPCWFGMGAGGRPPKYGGHLSGMEPGPALSWNWDVHDACVNKNKNIQQKK